MNSTATAVPPVLDRGRTTVIIAFAMALALLLNWAMRTTTERHAELEAALTQELVARHCVVADVEGHAPSLYKCDLPTPNTYVRAAELTADALAKYSKK